jgi:hypothetical protein
MAVPLVSNTASTQPVQTWLYQQIEADSVNAAETQIVSSHIPAANHGDVGPVQSGAPGGVQQCY